MRPHALTALLQFRSRRTIWSYACAVQSGPMNTSSRMSCRTILALFAVVHGEQDEVPDFEIFVLDFGSYCFDRSCALVAEDCRIRADFNYALLV